jgi:hypothetical protein
MLSFKGTESAPVSASAPANVSPEQSPPSGAVDTIQSAEPTKAAPAFSNAARIASSASGPPVEGAASSSDVNPKSHAAVAPAKSATSTQEMPAPQPPALVASVPSVAAQPQEPGIGGTAKIEARLTDLEMALKDRSNEARARSEAEKAESHTLEKIAELGALVARLTGQVRDLQDEMRTTTTVESEKFADITRRVALGEANRAVASAEKAGAAPFRRRPERMGTHTPWKTPIGRGLKSSAPTRSTITAFRPPRQASPC